MTYATKQWQVPVTYTETTTATRTGGSLTDNWSYWAVDATKATACTNEQFKAMVLASAGRSIAIGSITQIATRPNAIPVFTY